MKPAAPTRWGQRALFVASTRAPLLSVPGALVEGGVIALSLLGSAPVRA